MNLLPCKRKAPEIKNYSTAPRPEKRRKISTLPELPGEIWQRIFYLALSFNQNLLINKYIFNLTLNLYTQKALPHYYLFAKLTKLIATNRYFPKKAHVTGDGLTSSITSQLKKFTSLKCLKIHFFYSANEVDLQLQALTHLTKLSLRITRQTPLPPRIKLNVLPSLLSLEIPFSENLLTVIENVSLLKVLKIWDFPNSRQVLSKICQLTLLEHLALHASDHNINYSDSINSLGDLGKLTSLNSLSFECLCLAHVQHFQTLEKLYLLTNLKFKNVYIPKNLGLFPAITSLRQLTFSRIYDLPISLDLSSLTNLQSLNCLHGNFSYQRMQYLPMMTNLTSLTLVRCYRLKKQSIDMIEGLTNLKHLDLSQCPQINSFIPRITKLNSLKI